MATFLMPIAQLGCSVNTSRLLNTAMVGQFGSCLHSVMRKLKKFRKQAFETTWSRVFLHYCIEEHNNQLKEKPQNLVNI